MFHTTHLHTQKVFKTLLHYLCGEYWNSKITNLWPHFRTIDKFSSALLHLTTFHGIFSNIRPELVAQDAIKSATCDNRKNAGSGQLMKRFFSKAQIFFYRLSFRFLSSKKLSIQSPDFGQFLVKSRPLSRISIFVPRGSSQRCAEWGTLFLSKSFYQIFGG